MMKSAVKTRYSTNPYMLSWTRLPKRSSLMRHRPEKPPETESRFRRNPDRRKGIFISGSIGSDKFRSRADDGNCESIHPAVMLGRIGNADQVFLNGVNIGEEGIIGEQFSEMEYK